MAAGASAGPPHTFLASTYAVWLGLLRIALCHVMPAQGYQAQGAMGTKCMAQLCGVRWCTAQTAEAAGRAWQFQDKHTHTTSLDIIVGFDAERR
ncbi:hypothetical protein COO60DRAFT_439588 [Scenedesmus sp. NREL 46B-D3]|nr:hypothetical protein COO60DRAFT_439588 [Scenedesmus sp. NREL 46B-D3]